MNSITWPLERFTGKDVVFVGAGQGRAMAGIQQFLETHAQLKSFTGVDRQPGGQPLGFLHDYDPAQTMFIKNEGIPPDEMTVLYSTQLQLFFELVGLTGAKTVGITGTKGKSTTSSLTAHILQTAGIEAVLAGNIGVSPLLALDQATDQTVFVLELSSYQLADLQISPHISACLNLYNDHTDWHGSLEGYWEAKHTIMRFAGPGDVFIYNPTFAVMTEWAHDAACQTIAINTEDQLDLSQAQLFGDHNRLNALVAREIARQFAISDTISQQAINDFSPLKHRMQVVAVKQSRTYVDDAIGMTPESTTASLKAITERIGPVGCLLLGGKDRGYDFSELMSYIAELQIPNLVLFPTTVEKMRAAMPANYQPHIFEAPDMQQAVQFAAAQAPQNSVVLLSTGAPSYSLWKDFEDKGDQFQAAVNNLTTD